jgi:hypothetical protein
MTMMKRQAAGPVKEEDGTKAPVNVPASGFWRIRTTQELAAEQGVKPVEDFDALLGDFWPEDESVDEFLEEVYRLRDEEAEQEEMKELRDERNRSSEEKAERKDKAA